jgi:hypothetical protein
MSHTYLAFLQGQFIYAMIMTASNFGRMDGGAMGIAKGRWLPTDLMVTFNLAHWSRLPVEHWEVVSSHPTTAAYSSGL